LIVIILFHCFIKRAFYSSCNSIFMHTVNLNALAVLSLQESYSLSVFMYSIPAMSLSAKQIRELGICWNSVIGKLFKYNKWESDKGVLHGLGLLNISHLIMVRSVKFYKHLFYRLIVCCIMCSTLLWYTTTLVMTFCEQFSSRNV